MAVRRATFNIVIISSLSPLLLSMFPQRTAGTEVVIIGTTKAFYLAADSVEVDMLAGKRYLVCKIKHKGSFYWVHKGIVGNLKRHFQADNVFQEVIREDRTFDQVVSAYRKLMLPTIQREGPYMRKDNKTIYDDFVHNNTPILQLFLVRSTIRGFEAGIVKFRIVNGQFKDEIVNCSHSNPVCLLTSSGPAMGQYIQSHNSEIAKAAAGNPINVIDNMMEITHKSDPSHTGPPYSILEIGPFGGRWTRQNNCPAINTHD